MTEHRGIIWSDKEKWQFEGTAVSCLQGKWKDMAFTWDGSTFRSTSATAAAEANGWGEFTPGAPAWVWRFPAVCRGQQPLEFWAFGQAGDVCVCKAAAARGGVDWCAADGVDGGRVLMARPRAGQTTDDGPEGSSTSWEFAGNFPFPLTLFIAMFTRTQAMKEKYDERMNRSYSRCGRFAQLGKVPKLCAPCASKNPLECVCCRQPATDVIGKICKTCVFKAHLCAKCGDHAGPSKAEGRLCSACSLGSHANNCCRMAF
mmetsp:Transcript_46656/g.117536  ORF Transcript_46656/g.117536 Transcript_46656/m.117536 type:complete len:259 (+) Transcript_46656:67-843(+)